MIQLPDQLKDLFLSLLLTSLSLLLVIIVTVWIDIKLFEQPCRAKTSGILINESIFA